MITRRDCEELCVHDRGGVRWGGGAAQGKGQGYSLTSHRLTGRREGACVGDAELARRFSSFHPQRQPAACIAAVATWPAAQAESDKVHAVRLMSLLQLGCLGNGRKARETRGDNYLGKTISKSCVFIPSNRIAPSTQHIIQKVNF